MMSLIYPKHCQFLPNQREADQKASVSIVHNGRVETRRTIVYYRRERGCEPLFDETKLNQIVIHCSHYHSAICFVRLFIFILKCESYHQAIKNFRLKQF